MNMRGEQVTTVVQAVELITNGKMLYHGSHLFPAGKLKEWTLRKLIFVVKQGGLFVSVQQYNETGGNND